MPGSPGRWPWTRWAATAGLGAVAVASWVTVASGVVGSISIEPDPASLFQSYATEPLRAFGWPAALASSAAVVALLWQGRHRSVRIFTPVVGIACVVLVVLGVATWHGRNHPLAAYRRTMATLRMPPGFTDLGVRDASPFLGPPEVQRVWTTSLPASSACRASAVAIAAWADPGSVRTTAFPNATNLQFCSISATRGGDSVLAELQPRSTSVPVPGAGPYRVVVTVGPPTGV